MRRTVAKALRKEAGMMALKYKDQGGYVVQKTKRVIRSGRIIFKHVVGMELGPKDKIIEMETRRYSAGAARQIYRDLKRQWNRIPRPDRRLA